MRKTIALTILCLSGVMLITGCKSEKVKIKEEDVKTKNAQVVAALEGYRVSIGKARVFEKEARSYLEGGNLDEENGSARGFLDMMREDIKKDTAERMESLSKSLYDEEGNYLGEEHPLSDDEQKSRVLERIKGIDVKYYLGSDGVVEQVYRTRLESGKTCQTVLYWENGNVVSGSYEIVE